MGTDSNDPMAVAEAMMKERRDTVKSLSKVRDEKAAAQAKISELETQEAEAYELALASGWAQSELKKMGFTRKAGPRRSKRSTDTSATATPANDEGVSA